MAATRGWITSIACGNSSLVAHADMHMVIYSRRPLIDKCSIYFHYCGSGMNFGGERICKVGAVPVRMVTL